jgi:penicillin-binding protein 2
MNDNATLENKIEYRRILVFAVIMIVVFGFYLIRLLNLQIIDKSWSAQAEENRTTTINTAAQRGIISDRNGVILAQNIPSYSITVTAADLPDDSGPGQAVTSSAEVQEIMRQIALLTGIPLDRGEISTANPFVECKSDHGIKQIFNYAITSKPYDAVVIECNVPRDLAMIIQEKAIDWPGIGILVTPVRDYPTGIFTADVIGYLGPIPPEKETFYEDKGFLANRDKIGYAGVERWFQTDLAGQNGIRKVEVDSGGQILGDLAEPQAITPGSNIRLTIDYRLQQSAYSILVDEITYWNSIVQYPEYVMSSGVIIAMNPKTGEILAMVSYPSYENNRMAQEIPEYYYNQLKADLRLPLLNHAVGDQLPVGSVFKLVTATGALNEGVVSVDQEIQAPPVLEVTERFYANDPGQPRQFVEWNYKTLGLNGGFGQLTPIQAISQSCNVCFYKMGGGYQDEIPTGLGICRLRSYAIALGYNDSPEIQLPDRIDGLIPDPTWKRINQGQSWATGDTYIASVGQGFIIGTPLQVLLSASTIANDGKLMEPTILREKLDNEGNVTEAFNPVMRWDLTQDKKIDVFTDQSVRGCEPTGAQKTIEPWVFQAVQQGMRGAVTEGTLKGDNVGLLDFPIAVAGKTGTAEYCDQYARDKNRCQPGLWPSHAWTVAYAPFDNPEIAVVAFVYNGNEGSTVAGPIIRRVMKAYFELKAIDNSLGR